MIDVIANRYAEALFQLSEEENITKEIYNELHDVVEVIKNNKEWIFSGIYADKAITGTKVDKREEFQRLIQDCMDGKIDMIIAKSLPRFARNTLDTLKYVRSRIQSADVDNKKAINQFAELIGK